MGCLANVFASVAFRCRIHINTHGTRGYGELIKNLLDPEGKIFEKLMICRFVIHTCMYQSALCIVTAVCISLVTTSRLAKNTAPGL